MNKDQNPMSHSYLYYRKELAGIGMALKLGFNLKGQAILNTPVDALETFYGTGLDNFTL